MTTLIVLTVAEIVLLIAGLAVFLFWIGSLLNRIASNLADCASRVADVREHASDIVPGVEHINRTGRVVAGALPLLYGFAEKIVSTVTPAPAPRPVTGRRRSRMHETVGYTPQ